MNIGHLANYQTFAGTNLHLHLRNIRIDLKNFRNIEERSCSACLFVSMLLFLLASNLELV
jgi:hypothetical protein